jgi:HK97 family phage major capsid protein
LDLIYLEMEFKNWLKEKKNKETLEGLDVEEISGLYIEYNSFKSSLLEQALDRKATKEELDAIKEDLRNSQAEQVKSLNEQLKLQGLEIKRLTNVEQKSKNTFTSIKQHLQAKSEHLKAIKENGSREHFNFDLNSKAVGNMTITGNVTGEVPQAFREAGMNRIADRMPFVRNHINIGSVSSNVVSWVEQQNREGGAGGTAEGTAKNQADFDLVEATENVVKRTVYIKASLEMLDDIDFIESEIRNELLIRLNLDIDNQQLQGDGTGSNLTGLLTVATAYSAGTFAASIDNANNYDVLVTAINQVVIANFMPTVIFVNPSDKTEMMLTKGTDGHYIKFPFVSEDGGTIMGDIPIVANNGVPADTFLVMDGAKPTIFDKQSVRVDVGLDGNDFTNNFVTILAEWRGAQRVKGNDVPALVTGTFTAAKAALETP